MTDTRLKDLNWIVAGENGRAKSIEHVAVAVLMDIRDELQGIPIPPPHIALNDAIGQTRAANAALAILARAHRGVAA